MHHMSIISTEKINIFNPEPNNLHYKLGMWSVGVNVYQARRMKLNYAFLVALWEM